MDTVLILLTLSALIGFATSLRFNVLVIAILSVPIAFAAAIVLRIFDFGLWSGVLVVFGCLFVSQIAYIISPFLSPAHDVLLDDVPSEGHSGDGQCEIKDNENDNDA